MEKNFSAQVFDFSTGKEMVGIKKTNRKTFHVMKDGTMVSYFNHKPKTGLKEKVKTALNYFFELE